MLRPARRLPVKGFSKISIHGTSQNPRSIILPFTASDTVAHGLASRLGLCQRCVSRVISGGCAVHLEGGPGVPGLKRFSDSDFLRQGGGGEGQNEAGDRPLIPKSVFLINQGCGF